jgi:hypothetical protein
MADLHDQYRQPLILDTAEDSLVAYSITPQAGQFVLERLPVVANVFGVRYPFMEVAKDATLDRLVEFG